MVMALVAGADACATGGDPWPCRCGVTRCQGQVVGDYFQLPTALRREHAPYLADRFVRPHPDALCADGLVP